jgi:hypothetical protein
MPKGGTAGFVFVVLGVDVQAQSAESQREMGGIMINSKAKSIFEAVH